MPRLTIHPETGRLSRVVESYQEVELAQLQADVDKKQELVDELSSQRDSMLEDIDGKLSEAKAALEDSKSEFEMGQGLVGESAVREGEDGTGLEVENNY